jgi:site-specific recombinase XerC
MKAWLEESRRGKDGYVFPNAQGERLSADAVQHMLAKHAAELAIRKHIGVTRERV